MFNLAQGDLMSKRKEIYTKAALKNYYLNIEDEKNYQQELISLSTETKLRVKDKFVREYFPWKNAYFKS